MNLHPIYIYGPVPKLWKREPLLSSHIPKWKKAVTLILFIFLTVEPLPFLSLSADRPRKLVRVTPTFSSVRLSLPPSLSSGPFQAKNTGLGELLPPFPTGEGQVGSWEEYESCKRCHPDLEEVMGKLLVQPTEGKLLADLYSIEGSSINQIVQLLRPIS